MAHEYSLSLCSCKLWIQMVTLYQRIKDRFPECSLQVKDLEAFVREWEKTAMKPKVGATWFEEYVSDV